MADAATSSLPIWIPAVTALSGVVVGLFGPWLTSFATSKRERESRAEARRDALNQHHREFQRTTLLELQEWTLKLMRASSRINHLDLMEERDTGQWHSKLYPEELSSEAYEATSRTTVLTVRVKDEETRRLSEEMKHHHNLIVFARDRQQSQNAMFEHAECFRMLNERIGKLLRELEALDVR